MTHYALGQLSSWCPLLTLSSCARLLCCLSPGPSTRAVGAQWTLLRGHTAGEGEGWNVGMHIKVEGTPQLMYCVQFCLLRGLGPVLCSVSPRPQLQWFTFKDARTVTFAVRLGFSLWYQGQVWNTRKQLLGRFLRRNF